LNHVRHTDLCSPTSTAVVTRFLSRNASLDPVVFALKAWDGGFDIFGNWVFTVAEAAAHLGPEWHCWVERLGGFDDFHARWVQGAPVVVRVRGPWPGSAHPKAKGDLMAVVGYDPETNTVKCADSALPTHEETAVSDELEDFVQASGRRGRVAYVFNKRGK